MAKQIPLNALHQAIRRKLEDLDLPESGREYRLHGNATVFVDCTVLKLEDTEGRETLRPEWPAVLAVFCQNGGLLPEQVIPAIAAALDQAEDGQADATYLAAAKFALQTAAEKLPKKPRAGATKVTGKVELTGFVESKAA